MSTPVTKQKEAAQQWYVADAKDQVLGRLATRIATVLRGKHEPTYTPHVPTNNHVVVVNGGGFKVTGNKLEAKTYYRHSQQPGSLKSRPLVEELRRHPTRPLERAVERMLPDNKLRSVWMNHLHVYEGTEHPHTAQNPQELPHG